MNPDVYVNGTSELVRANRALNDLDVDDGRSQHDVLASSCLLESVDSPWCTVVGGSVFVRASGIGCGGPALTVSLPPVRVTAMVPSRNFVSPWAHGRNSHALWDSPKA